MKKFIIIGIVILIVIGIGAGFGVSFFASSKLDEAISKPVEIDGLKFQPGTVETSIGFLSSSKLIKNSKLTLKEITFDLPEISIHVDTSQVDIKIPNVEGELPGGVKINGSDARISAPVSSNKDSFMVKFEVENITGSTGDMQVAAKALKGDISKKDKSLDYNTLSIGLSELKWNAKNPGSGSAENLKYNEKLTQYNEKINSDLSLSFDKLIHEEEDVETTLESFDMKAKYSANSTDSNLNTLFILQEIDKGGIELVLADYQLELINGNISIGEIKVDDFFRLTSFSYNEIIEREGGKHKADLKIEFGSIDTRSGRDRFISKLSSLHTKLQVENITSLPLPTTLMIIEEIGSSDYNQLISTRKPDIEFLNINSQDGTTSKKGTKKFSYSLINAGLSRVLQGDVSKANINIKAKNMDLFSNEGILQIGQADFVQETSIPQKSFNRLYILDENLSEAETAELFFELIEQFKFNPKISIENVKFKPPKRDAKGVLLNELSAVADLNFEKGNGDASVELKTSVSKLLNLRKIGSPIGFDDLTLRVKIALNKIALGAWKEGIQQAIREGKGSRAEAYRKLDKAIQGMIKLKPELIFEIEGGQKDLNVLMASLSFKLDRGTPEKIGHLAKGIDRDPLGTGKKIFYQHGSTNLKVDVRDIKALTSMVDKSLQQPGLTEMYLSEFERFFESGENSLKTDLLIKGDEVMLNGKSNEELNNMNEMLIKQ